MAKITKRLVDALYAKDRDVFVWDSELRGFGVRAKPSGVKSYVVQYRNQQGRSRRITIGSHGRLAPTEARIEARKTLADVDRGGDPAQDRAALRTAPSMRELCERYLLEHASEHKKQRSIETDASNIRNHILPLVGHIKVADVTRVDIDRLKRAVKDGRTAKDEKIAPRKRIIVKGGSFAANRCLALLSKMFNLAEAWGLRPDGSNPVRHIKKYPEEPRERFLKSDEIKRLGDVLSNAEQTHTESRSVIAAIRLLAFTGCRVSEILNLQWDWVDFDRACLRLPDSKSGKKTVPLSAPALEVLARIEHVDRSPFVLHGATGGQLINLQKPWRRIRKAARLEDVRLHDLRHSFASIAAGLGEGLHMIGKMLGHNQPQTTHRYAHLAIDPVRAATERVGSSIAAAMSGSGAQILPIQKAGQSQKSSLQPD